MNDSLGKTIKIYLKDGEPEGIKVAEIINWTGRAIECSRSQLDQLKDRKEVTQPGIYFLIGPDPQHPNKNRVYVGEADNVLNRLKNHVSDDAKDFWTDTVLLISKDKNLTKSHVGYLESRILDVMKEADRASIANTTTPSPNQLPESDQDDMEFFLNQMRLILPVLGYAFLRPQQTEQISSSQGPTFELEAVGAKATAKEIDGEFIVIKGSTARIENVDSMDTYVELKEQLVDEEKLISTEDNDYYKFTQDVAFNSPSAAAAVICGSNRNGRKEWKVQSTGKQYKEWEAEKLDSIGFKNE